MRGESEIMVRSRKINEFLNQYLLFIFFLLTYTLSWWTVPLMDGALLPQGPALAAVIVIAFGMGKDGLQAFWKRITHWRADYWYLVGPAIIIAYQGIGFIINLLLGASVIAWPPLPNIETVVLLLVFGGQWEELGWTAYALPKLQERFGDHPNGRLTAAVVLGIFRAIWHLPLYLQGKIFWFDFFIFEIAFQVIIAWLYYQSGESVLPVVVFHFASNLFGSIMSPLFAGSDRISYYATFMGIAVLISLAIVFKTWQKNQIVATVQLSHFVGDYDGSISSSLLLTEVLTLSDGQIII